MNLLGYLELAPLHTHCLYTLLKNDQPLNQLIAAGNAPQHT